MRYRSAKTVRTEMSLAGAWKQLRWSSDCGQGPEYCSRPTDQQYGRSPAAISVEVGDVVRAVDVVLKR